MVGKLIGWRTDGNEIILYSDDYEDILAKAKRNAVNRPYLLKVFQNDKWVNFGEFSDPADVIAKAREALVADH